jgi:hypothetical protein
MNKTFLSATAAMLSFSIASSALAAGAHMARPPHPMDTAGVVTQSEPQKANPTGIPAYLMRSDGSMTNGLLPNNGWQG